jgi:EAL domain-containing protein (putative c-di-GMP-specific phosphodiesterase class I)/FixJ family two-component response regulator
MDKRRFLILDDDEAVGQTIQFMAQSLGMDARFVSKPQQFFQELDDWSPEFITVDLVMPEMDGVEIIRQLAERHCPARIIITSGMGGRVLDAARRSADDHGLDIAGVLPKPLAIQSLAELIGPSITEPVKTTKKVLDSLFIATREELDRAVEDREFVIALQPKIACGTRELVGFEALVRWQHPERGMIFPDSFIPAVEEFDHIDALSEQVFELGVRWLSQTFPNSDVSLSLNLSAKSFQDFHLIDHLSNLCSRYSVRCQRLVLELTESSTMQCPLLALDLMTRFRMRGFSLSIDDFGTGFSSMVQLVRLPFSEIKVDKSFVLSATQSQESKAVVKSIIDLGHSLGLQVVAEGVEDEKTLGFLESLGCDFVQGYYIARPMLPEGALAWVSQVYPDMLA